MHLKKMYKIGMSFLEDSLTIWIKPLEMCMKFDPETIPLGIYPKDVTGKLPKHVYTVVAIATLWIIKISVTTQTVLAETMK